MGNSFSLSTFRFLTQITLALLFCGIPLVAQELATDQEPTKVASATESENSLAFLNSGGIPESVEQLRMMERQLADVAERAMPATVNLEVGQAQGSGVVVSRDGYILTAAHVIGRPNRTANVTFPDGTKVKAISLGVNRSFDTGMLKILTPGKWPYLDIGQSETLKKGQWVLAIGHPGGLTKDRGLVVRIGRVLSNMAATIRTDCALVGGDSGGPLIDMDGNVVGIHSRIGSDLSQNMHAQIDAFTDEWDQLAAGVVVGSTRPMIGINMVGDTNEVESVFENEGADRAGIKKGDIIIRVNDLAVNDRSDLGKAMNEVKPGDKVKIIVKRGDEEKEFEVELGYQ